MKVSLKLLSENEEIVRLLSPHVQIYAALTDKLELEFVLKHVGLENTLWVLLRLMGPANKFMTRFKRNCLSIDNKIAKLKVNGLNRKENKILNKIENSKHKIEMVIKRAEHIKTSEAARMNDIYESTLVRVEKEYVESISKAENHMQEELVRVEKEYVESISKAEKLRNEIVNRIEESKHKEKIRVATTQQRVIERVTLEETGKQLELNKYIDSNDKGWTVEDEINNLIDIKTERLMMMLEDERIEMARLGGKWESTEESTRRLHERLERNANLKTQEERNLLYKK